LRIRHFRFPAGGQARGEIGDKDRAFVGVHRDIAKATWARRNCGNHARRAKAIGPQIAAKLRLQRRGIQLLPIEDEKSRAQGAGRGGRFIAHRARPSRNKSESRCGSHADKIEKAG